MSNLLWILKQRRSIRIFQNKPVPREHVGLVLEAAGLAPSAHNSQPWRFIVIEDPVTKRVLAEKMAEAWAADMAKDGLTVDETKRLERQVRFAEAPVLIVACFSMDGLRSYRDEERQRCERDLAAESLGAALENLLLAAYSLGLGACWYCAPAFCKPTVRAVLKIPTNIEPSALIVMGFPAEAPTAPPKKRPEEYCYADVWSNPFTNEADLPK
ncbi:MAG: nitroreductase family protein [Methanocella sp.]|jgi:coenzyme F420-0:L-glutamate ligase/coenzyme F420-1:gamma-L-glutamate ligase